MALIDEPTLRLYLLVQYFAHHGFEFELLALPTNEGNKSFDIVFKIAEELERFGINR